ncbi:MAG: CapA family protein [Chloroflexota bacterium]
MKRPPLLVLVGLLALALAVPLVAGQLTAGQATTTEPSALASASAAASGAALASPTGRSSGPAASTRSSSPPASTAPSLPPADGPVGDVLIVPVTSFRTTAVSTTRSEVEAALAGTSGRFSGLELVAGETDSILAAFKLQRPSSKGHLTEAADPGELASDLAGDRKRLGLLRADELGPAVRALGWGNRQLFGVDRVRKAADWPLTARLPTRTGEAAFDPGKTWTLFAGGDIMLDRGVHQTLVVKGKGADFPFDGGTAEITGHTCCSGFGWRVPTTRRTGDRGAMRDLIEGADIAIANFENPAPDAPRWHTRGTVFSAQPRLIDGLRHAGIDYVSLANNHIRDAGGVGVLQTMANLDRRGIAHSGAGKNLAAARRPAILEAAGGKVAILAYDAIAPVYHAGSERIGSAPLSAKIVRQDVAAARKAGAGVVIVFPHWGTEYREKPFAKQQQLARAIIDAGADMVIGNHAHWAAAVEVYKGRPIWYALGNFVFDQTWSEPTMEGITLELTFERSRLVQARMRPHIILDKAQPNLLDPAGDGRVVMGQVFGASKNLLPW